MSAKYRTVIHANGVEFITNYPAGHGAAREGLDVELSSRQFRQCWESASVQRWDATQGDGGWTTLSHRVSDYEPDDRPDHAGTIFAALLAAILVIGTGVILWALQQ